MRKKTINKVIKQKVCEWIESITDPYLRKKLLTENKIVVTGGCITSMLLQEKANDFDIYFTDLATTREVANYYNRSIANYKYEVVTCDSIGNFEGTEEYDSKCEDKYVHLHLQDAGYLTEDRKNLVQDDVSPSDVANAAAENDTGAKYRPVFITSNAITLSHQVQLIIRFSGTPDKIHENFDFTHTKMYWTMEDGVVTNADSLECVLAKRMIYSGSKFPLCSIIRTRKFLNRGWSIDAGQYVKMAIQLNNIDLTDPRVLVQQLIGVDTTYFAWMLDALTAANKLKDGSVDTEYALQLLDKLFDS